MGMVGFHWGIFGFLDTMLCCWFAVGLIEEVLVEEEGKEEMAEHCERERQSIGRQTSWKGVFFYVFFFFVAKRQNLEHLPVTSTNQPHNRSEQ